MRHFLFPCLIVLAQFVATTQRLNATLPADVKTFLDDPANSVTEDGLLPETPQALAAARYFVTNWREMPSQIVQIAPDTRRQRLILVSAEFLPPRDYLAFVSEVLALGDSSKIATTSVAGIASAGMFKDGFLAFNYDKPEVASVIQRLESILVADDRSRWTDFFAAIKNGQNKQRIVAQRTRDDDPLPESIDAGPSDFYRQLMSP
jgi:hypothetical protein